MTEQLNPAAGDSPPGSPRRASMSLQAAATMNAGLQSEVSRSRSTSPATPGERNNLLCAGPGSNISCGRRVVYHEQLRGAISTFP